MAGVMPRALRRRDRQQPRTAAAGPRARGRVRYPGHRQGPAWPSRAGHNLTDPSKEPDPAKCQADMANLTNHGNAHTAAMRAIPADTNSGPSRAEVLLCAPWAARAQRRHRSCRSRSPASDVGVHIRQNLICAMRAVRGCLKSLTAAPIWHIPAALMRLADRKPPPARGAATSRPRQLGCGGCR